MYVYSLAWIPGHSSVLVNKKADLLTKLGTETPFIGLKPVVWLLEQFPKLPLKNWSSEEHKNI